MSIAYCCVPECNSWKKRNPDVTFHRFPAPNKNKVFVKDAFGKTLVDRRKLWINKLKIRKKVSNYMVVCSLHFQESDFYKGNIVNLKNVFKQDHIN